MTKKGTIKLLSFCIGASFFLPIFKWHSWEMSGLNFVLSTHIESYKYFLLLIPISSVVLFLKPENEHKLFVRSKTLCLLPLLSLLLVAIMYVNNNTENGFNDNGTTFSKIDIGFGLIIIFSLLLVIVATSKDPVKEEANDQHEVFQ